MRFMLTTALLSALALQGCSSGSGSRALNPFKWGAKTESPEAATASNALIPQRSALKRAEAPYNGVALEQILQLSLEPAAGGAILRVTGLSATLGAYNVALIPDDPTEQGVAAGQNLSYTLKAEYPKGRARTAPPRAREVSAALFLPDTQMRTLNEIRVKAAQNMRKLRP